MKFTLDYLNSKQVYQFFHTKLDLVEKVSAGLGNCYLIINEFADYYKRKIKKK